MLKRSAFIVALSLYISSVGFSQDTLKENQDAIGLIDSTLNIITKVPFNGRYYYIRIVPVDSGNPDNMPIVDPNKRFRYIPWKDSLQRLLPDSILKHLDKLRPKP